MDLERVATVILQLILLAFLFTISLIWHTYCRVRKFLGNFLNLVGDFPHAVRNLFYLDLFRKRYRGYEDQYYAAQREIQFQLEVMKHEHVEDKLQIEMLTRELAGTKLELQSWRLRALGLALQIEIMNGLNRQRERAGGQGAPQEEG
ncbi:hypothetical protein QBC46DRAFT_347265 [Diplogelasinospora grovesii]|uniref:Uncharacterized protein n=1 Tax=Diplogelasinospora grovesii TaxID=303347 RepID=A0AAN6S016_9PEZI|nr:hypothetical protein QBC46DRAFT_347265 [Diplogelasinospora grovesii]